MIKVMRDRYHDDIVGFAESEFVLPETGEPIVLTELQKSLLRYVFEPDKHGRFRYETVLLGQVKRSGKTTLEALIALWIAACRDPDALVLLAANDKEQAKSRAFGYATQVIEANPRLRRYCEVLAEEIRLPHGSIIKAIPSRWQGVTGGRASMSGMDEVWAFEGENDRRLYEELQPPPDRKDAFRLITTHAGFENTLLHELYQRGMSGKQVREFKGVKGLEARTDGRFIMLWDTAARQPWQTATWREERRRDLRGHRFAQQIENRFVLSEHKAFPTEWIDECIDPAFLPWRMGERLPEKAIVCGGVDVGITNDWSAITVVAYDPEKGRYALLRHKFWEPGGHELNLERTVEAELLSLQKELSRLDGVYYDEFQMASSAQRLAAKGIPMQKVVQSQGNQTVATTILYKALEFGDITLYPCPDLRDHLLNCQLIERDDFVRLAKEKRHKKIDGAVALSMAMLGCQKVLAERAEDDTAEFSFATVPTELM